VVLVVLARSAAGLDRRVREFAANRLKCDEQHTALALYVTCLFCQTRMQKGPVMGLFGESRGELRQQRDEALSDRDAVRAERDAVRAERDEMKKKYEPPVKTRKVIPSGFETNRRKH
jgi:hypothetical protein